MFKFTEESRGLYSYHINFSPLPETMKSSLHTFVHQIYIRTLSKQRLGNFLGSFISNKS